MRKPIQPERAAKLTDNLKKLTGKTDDAGQAAVGEVLRQELPFENNYSGGMTATIPLPNENTAGISYAPAKPNDFHFSVKDPSGIPMSVEGVPGMENGETETVLRPLDVAPALEKAGGIEKTTQFAARLSTPSTGTGRSA